MRSHSWRSRSGRSTADGCAIIAGAAVPGAAQHMLACLQALMRTRSDTCPLLAEWTVCEVSDAETIAGAPDPATAQQIGKQSHEARNKLRHRRRRVR